MNTLQPIILAVFEFDGDSPNITSSSCKMYQLHGYTIQYTCSTRAIILTDFSVIGLNFDRQTDKFISLSNFLAIRYDQKLSSIINKKQLICLANSTIAVLLIIDM